MIPPPMGNFDFVEGLNNSFPIGDLLSIPVLEPLDPTWQRNLIRADVVLKG